MGRNVWLYGIAKEQQPVQSGTCVEESNSTSDINLGERVIGDKFQYANIEGFPH